MKLIAVLVNLSWSAMLKITRYKKFESQNMSDVIFIKIDVK